MGQIHRLNAFVQLLEHMCTWWPIVGVKVPVHTCTILGFRDRASSETSLLNVYFDTLPTNGA
jgi:hypothetical protein